MVVTIILYTEDY